MDSSRPGLDRPNYFCPNSGPAHFSLSFKIAEPALNLIAAAGPQFRNSISVALAPSFGATEPQGVLLGALTIGPPVVDVMDSGSWSLVRNYLTVPLTTAFTGLQAARTTNPLFYLVNTPGLSLFRAFYFAAPLKLQNTLAMSGFGRGNWATPLVLHNTTALVPSKAALNLVKQPLSFAASTACNTSVLRRLNLAISVAAAPHLSSAMLPETFHLVLVLRLAPAIDPSLAGPELVFDSLAAFPDDTSAPLPWLVFYPGNTQGLRLDGLYEPDRDLFVTNATLIATLQDAEGVPVWGLNEVAMLYVNGTPASYEAAIDGNEFNPAPGNYSLVLLGNKNGSTLRVVVPAVVEPRKR